MNQWIRVKIKTLTCKPKYFLIKIYLFQINPVILNNSNKTIKTNTILDSSSDITLVSNGIWKRIDINGKSKNLNINNTLAKILN